MNAFEMMVNIPLDVQGIKFSEKIKITEFPIANQVQYPDQSILANSKVVDLMEFKIGAYGYSLSCQVGKQEMFNSLSGDSNLELFQTGYNSNLVQLKTQIDQ